MQPFFINPKKRRRKAKSRRKRTARKRLFGAAAMAKRGKLMGAAAKAARRRPAAKRSRRKARRRGTIKSIRRAGSKRPVSRAAWRASGFRRNLMARRRRRTKRRYRRNPRLFGGGMVKQAMDIGIGGAGVVAGKVVARQGIRLIPNLDPSSPVGIAAQLGIALAAGIGARRFLRLRGPFVDGLVYGAAAGAAESAIKLIAPGVASQLLGEYDYEVPLAAYPSPAALPPSREQASLIGAYATGMY